REQKPSAEHHRQQGPRHRRAHNQHEAHQARDPLSPKNIGGSRFSGAEEQRPAVTPAPAVASQPDKKQEAAVTTHFGSADEFVRKQLIGSYRRRVIAHGSGGGMRWKAAWWDSEEAQQRMEALWRSWEAARQDEKAGMSSWWINHCDPHMKALLSPEGPFADSKDENRIGAPLPYTAAPDGMFKDDRQPLLYTEQQKQQQEEQEGQESQGGTQPA
ncbi:DUF4913 domain-containing protein, partial [Subtercola boreus]